MNIFLSYVVFYIYRFIALPIAIQILYFVRPFLSAKMQEFLQDRKYANWPEVSARPVWIHAASGEIEYAKPLIRNIKSRWPQRPILVTYFSPSAKKLIKNIPQIDVSMALPWDREKIMQKFLRHFNPQLLCIARTDAWPEMLLQTRKKRIPSIMFASTLSTESSRTSLLAKYLTLFSLNQLSMIQTVSEEDKDEICKTGVKTPVIVAGDTRYDQVEWRIQHPNLIKQELKPKTFPVLVAGSTWPEDENILLPALAEFLKNGGKVILAPHEIGKERISRLCRQITENQYLWQLYSKATDWESSHFLIIDHIGVLPELYSWGSFAFVGGSFKAKVHSVMEPLACGLPVLVGPYHSNNREALHFQNISHKFQQTLLPAVEIVYSSQDIAKSIRTLCSLQNEHSKIKSWIASKIKEKMGSSQILQKQIEVYLDQ